MAELSPGFVSTCIVAGAAGINWERPPGRQIVAVARFWPCAPQDSAPPPLPAAKRHLPVLAAAENPPSAYEDAPADCWASMASTTSRIFVCWRPAGHYKKPHKVGNFFQRAKRCRRIGTRYEETKTMFVAFITLFSTMNYFLH